MNQILETVDSTNRIAREWAQSGAPHGTWVAARTQTGGRGRGDHTWESPFGNLYISWIIRDIPTDRLTWIPLVAALATRSVLQKHIGIDPVVCVKWPNDLWVNEKKIAGFLAENQGGSIILGAGVNLLKTPPSLATEATCLQEWAPDYTANLYESFILELNQKILYSLDLLRHGTLCFEIEYNQFAALPAGTTIQWIENNQVREGVVKEIGKFAELKVQGQGVWGDRSLYSETVSKLKDSKIRV